MAQPMTQRERLATLEAHHAAHAREHELWRELEATQLEAIGARLANIETALGAGRPGGNGGRRISRRDVGVFGGSIAMATALWWMVDLLRAASGG